MPERVVLKLGASRIAVSVDTEARMIVAPSTPLSSIGVEGGPFSPSSAVYTIRNAGSGSLSWTASVDAAWLTVTPASGTLGAGQITQITVEIDPDANSLTPAVEMGTLTVTNTTNGVGTTTRGVNLQVLDVDDLADAVTRHGITWTFDGFYRVGQFVNGDWWVLDEGSGVVVTSVSPAAVYGASGRNGSVINPTGSMSQPIDARAASYSIANRVDYPVTLTAGDSLVSWESRPNGDPNAPDVIGVMRSLSGYSTKGAAVLTVVNSVPAADAFRPPYCGTEKPIYLWSDVEDNIVADPTLRPDLASTGGYLTRYIAGQSIWQILAGIYERVDPAMWAAGTLSQELTGIDNWLGYYAQAYAIDSEAMLALCCEATGADATWRDTLLQRFIQRGIDMHYAVKSYASSLPSRGDRRLWELPGYFAGLFLDVAEMTNGTYGNGYDWFKTFDLIELGSSWTGADVVYNHESINTAAGESHELTDPTVGDGWCGVTIGDVDGWKAETYRRQTHSWNWVGGVLAFCALGQEALLTEKLRKYVDRWMLYGSYSGDDDGYDAVVALLPVACGTYTGIGYRQGLVLHAGGTSTTTGFVAKMWSAYRGDY